MAAVIPAAAMLVGGLINHFGRRREVNTQNRYNTEAEQRAREDAEKKARAAAAVYRSILEHYGYGGYATDDQLFNALLRAPGTRPRQAGPSIFGQIGGALETYGKGGLGNGGYGGWGGSGFGGGSAQPGVNIPASLAGEEGMTAGRGSVDWDRLLQIILDSQRRSPMEGGTSAGYMTPGYSPGR